MTGTQTGRNHVPYDDGGAAAGRVEYAAYGVVERGLGIEAAPIANTHLSISTSVASPSGVIADFRNTSTATNSFSQVELDANNTSTIATFTCDGLGSGVVLGAAGAYIGTFTAHMFGLTTAGTLRASIDSSGNCIWGSTAGANRVRTSLGTPASLSNGDWWVEASGTTPTRVIALKCRDGGVTQTIASITI